MRPKTIMMLALMFATSLASAQHCRKVDVDKSSGYCTVPDPSLTAGEMDASLACSPSRGHLHQVSDSEKDLILVAYGFPSDKTTKSSGEFDHWFPEWMGGSDGPKNIWFEPHAGKFGSCPRMDKTRSSTVSRGLREQSSNLVISDTAANSFEPNQIRTLGERSVSMEILLIGRNPVRCDVPLRRRQVESAGTDQFVKSFFQRVLDARIPCRRCVGFGPQIVDLFHTTQPRSNQVIDLIVVGVSIHNAVLLKNLLAQRC